MDLEGWEDNESREIESSAVQADSKSNDQSGSTDIGKANDSEKTALAIPDQRPRELTGYSGDGHEYRFLSSLASMCWRLAPTEELLGRNERYPPGWVTGYPSVNGMSNLQSKGRLVLDPRAAGYCDLLEISMKRLKRIPRLFSSDSNDPTDDERVVLFSNLNDNVTEAFLRELLEGEKFNVVQVEEHRYKGRNIGLTTVQMAVISDAEALVRSKNGITLMGNQIRVEQDPVHRKARKKLKALREEEVALEKRKQEEERAREERIRMEEMRAKEESEEERKAREGNQRLADLRLQREIQPKKDNEIQYPCIRLNMLPVSVETRDVQNYLRSIQSPPVKHILQEGPFWLVVLNSNSFMSLLVRALKRNPVLAIRGFRFNYKKESLTESQLKQMIEVIQSKPKEAPQETRERIPESPDDIVRLLIQQMSKELVDRSFTIIRSTILNRVAEAIVDREWERYSTAIKRQNLSESMKGIPRIAYSSFTQIPETVKVKLQKKPSGEDGVPESQRKSVNDADTGTENRGDDKTEELSDIDDNELEELLASVVKPREQKDEAKEAKVISKRKTKLQTEEEYLQSVEDRKRRRLEKQKQEDDLQLEEEDFSEASEDEEVSRRENPSGSARSEPFRKLEFSEKIRASPDQMRLWAGLTPAQLTTVQTDARTDRNTSRKIRRGIEALDLEKRDILFFNQLRSRRKKTKFGRSRIHGYGLYAMENIEPHEFVIEYVGEIVRFIIADLREINYTRQGMGDSYLFRLDWTNVVDATRKGAVSRFINHSCQPNLIAKNIVVEGQTKIVFYSKTQIRVGDELTYDYKFEAEEEKIPCLCGSPQCRGFLN